MPNDVVLKNNDTLGSNHFRIRYCPYKNKYLMKDMEIGQGTFIRIEEPTILQSGTVICVGESHIVVGLIFDNLCEKDLHRSMSGSGARLQNMESFPYVNDVISSQIMLKFIRGPRICETIKFMPDDAPILIGRNFNCHI